MKSLLRRLSKSLLLRSKRRARSHTPAVLEAVPSSEPGEITDGRHSVAVSPSASSLSDCATVCSSGYGSASTLLSEEQPGEEEEERGGDFNGSPSSLEDEVFAEEEEEEEEEGDGWEQWNIAASELAVDKCVSTSHAETVYRLAHSNGRLLEGHAMSYVQYSCVYVRTCT